MSLPTFKSRQFGYISNISCSYSSSSGVAMYSQLPGILSAKGVLLVNEFVFVIVIVDDDDLPGVKLEDELMLGVVKPKPDEEELDTGVAIEL
ncbi:MAG: hypothetical protein CMB97_05100 [Flavobacteriaceae bacterium]|nr:hypothetical protein [Flavobacteriaceae bacterium]